MNIIFHFFKYKIKLIPVIFLLLVTLPTNGQEVDREFIINDTVYHSKQEIKPEVFNPTLLSEVIYAQINNILAKRELTEFEQNKILTKAAIDQAVYMAKTKNDDVVRDDRDKLKKTTGDRIIYYKGTMHGEERTGKTNISRGKTPYTYAKVADDIVFKWFSSPKRAAAFENGTFRYIGIGARLDDKKKKVYVSAVLGNHLSFNNGTIHLKELPVPVKEKKYGLKEESYSSCKRVDRMDHLNSWQRKLFVQNNSIYFKTDDDREVKRILREKKDGLAVDILQKEQYPCNDLTIVDHNKMYHGFLTRPVYSKKFFKRNEFNPRESDSVLVKLGELPEEITPGYELNLVIIQDKQVCRLIHKSFLFNITGEYNSNLSLIADTVTINSKFSYKPTADSVEFSLRVPFENKKYNYKPSDIEPFIEVLNEPKFYIHNLKITAYSSIEGSDEFNRMLQHKRAESIVQALNKRQTDDINVSIVTKYNWDDFKKDIINTDYSSLADVEMDSARAFIHKNNLKPQLENILKKHRYAQIDMGIVYDIEGDNEKAYVVSKFNKAVKENNRILALSIQKYILKQIIKGRYSDTILCHLNIPVNSEFAGIYMNQVFTRFKYGNLNLEKFRQWVDSLHQIAPGNEYITYNNLLLTVKHEPIKSIDEALLMQREIEQLYYSSLQKKTVDRLNLKHRLKTIAFVDSVGLDFDIIEEALENLKSIVDFDKETMGNSMKWAELYLKIDDYKTAREIIERWVRHPGATVDMLLTYVSLCSIDTFDMHTPKFEYAMQRIFEIEPKTFCELLSGDYFSLKVFENMLVRKKYCESCK